MIVALGKLLRGKSRTYRIRYAHTATGPTVFGRPPSYVSESCRRISVKNSTASEEKDSLGMVPWPEHAWTECIAGRAPTKFPSNSPSIGPKHSNPVSRYHVVRRMLGVDCDSVNSSRVLRHGPK